LGTNPSLILPVLIAFLGKFADNTDRQHSKSALAIFCQHLPEKDCQTWMELCIH